MANTLNLYRNGAVGFIVWLDLRRELGIVCGRMLIVTTGNTDADEDAEENSGEQLFHTHGEHKRIALHGKRMLEKCDNAPAQSGCPCDERCNLRPTRLGRPAKKPNDEHEADRPEHRRDDENQVESACHEV